MSEMDRVGIVGSGIAGLACARRLADAGWSPVVFDKGRGVGGRTATRRAAEGAQFDHGAQYATARSADFQSFMQGMAESGVAARWDSDAPKARYVGIPGMNALAKHLAAGLDVRQGEQVTGISHTALGWRLLINGEEHHFSRIVVTTPAPQTVALLGPVEPVASEISRIRYEPCLTLMARLPPSVEPGFVTRSDPEDAIAWIANDSSKCDRPVKGCWVAQANPAWSAEHLELDFDAIAARMLPLFCDRLVVAEGDVRHAAAHRWRYARVVQPLGRPFVCNASNTLYAGGDWCLGARVEAAWISGDAIARDILRHG